LLLERAVRRHPAATALSPLHLLALLSVVLGALIWGAASILGGQGLQLQSYLALLGLYGAWSAAFVAARIRRAKLQLFEIPVYITVLFFFQFGLAPLRNFIDPTQLDVNLSANGEELVQALSYIILGMGAFWMGCELFRRKGGDRFSAGPPRQSVAPQSQRGRVLLQFGVLYALGLVTRIYLLKNHLYAYTASMDEYYANLGSMQVVNVIAEFGTLALIVATIERYRQRYDPLWRILFSVALSSEILWGLISGQKSSVLQNFLVVALVSSFVMKRLNLRWFVILFFGLVLLYPISNAYRTVVRVEGTDVSSFGGAAQAGQTAFNKVGEGGSSAGSIRRQGLDSALERLDLLTSVAQVLTLGERASMVKGDAQWWMLPIYPFVPRLLWPSKPILLEAGRFTGALGNGNLETVGSGTAISYPGDLYLQFGLLGIPVGMFVLGIVTQWFTNRMSGEVEPRELFIYTAVFILGFSFEADVFLFWTGFIRMLAVFYVMRLLIYGPRTQHRRPAPSFPVRARRP
jgi:hypothetical protein